MKEIKKKAFVCILVCLLIMINILNEYIVMQSYQGVLTTIIIPTGISLLNYFLGYLLVKIITRSYTIKISIVRVLTVIILPIATLLIEVAIICLLDRLGINNTIIHTVVLGAFESIRIYILFSLIVNKKIHQFKMLELIGVIIYIFLYCYIKYRLNNAYSQNMNQFEYMITGGNSFMSWYIRLKGIYDSFLLVYLATIYCLKFKLTSGEN